MKKLLSFVLCCLLIMSISVPATVAVEYEKNRKRYVALTKNILKDVKLPCLSDYMGTVEEIDQFLEESLNNTCNFTNARDNFGSSQKIFCVCL